MGINSKKIIHQTHHPLPYLDRDLRPADSVTLSGIVESVKNNKVKIKIYAISTTGQFSGSTSGSYHNQIIELDIE